MGKSNTNNKSDKTGSYTEFFYKAFRNILLVSIPLLIISALVLSIPRSSADNDIASSDELTLTLSSSCTLRSEVEEAHTATLNGGQYEEGIGITRVSTYCNDNNGYSIYAIGSSNNIDGNTDLVSNINDNYNISTGLYNSSAITPSSPSTWSMKLTAGTGTGINPDTGASVVLTPPTIVNGFNNYSLVPDTYTLVASRSSATDLSSNTDVSGSYFTTTYNIYASSYQPAGTYSGKVKYLILHPQSTTNTIPDIDAAFAIAGKSKVYSDENGSYYAMQDMSTDICNSVSQNGERTSTQLVDIRDNKLYWVTKLKDGHCWMTQNLDLDINANTTLSSNTTDLNVLYDASTNSYREYQDGYTSNGNIIYWKPANTATTISFQNTGPVTGWQNSNTEPYSANKTDSTETGHTSLGNYYNWTAAIASNDSSSLTQDTISDISKNPQNSICPKGWRLPTISSQSGSDASSTNEFARLNYLYNNSSTNNITGLISSPIFLNMSGYIFQNLNQISNYGIYYSSTTKPNSKVYYLEFHKSPAGVFIDMSGDRFYGLSVRCVAK